MLPAVCGAVGGSEEDSFPRSEVTRRREHACGRHEFMHVWLQPEWVRMNRAPGPSSLWRSFALMAGRVLSV